jgi:hypothetical protein
MILLFRVFLDIDKMCDLKEKKKKSCLMIIGGKKNQPTLE